MQTIYILGAGGFGRELLQWIKDINEKEPTWEIGGFLDDNPHALDEYEHDTEIVGSISGWQPKENEVFALAMGTPERKRRIVELIKSKGGVFADVIHPTALLSPFAHYGEGFIMFPYSKLSCNSTVGDFVTLLSTPIGHDTTVGDYSVISGGCSIVRNVSIGHDTFMSAGVCIAQDVNIGNNCYIGLGSVVLKDVADNCKTFGNPARVMPL